MVTAERTDQRKAVGGRIREWRLRRDLSQAEVARVAGITQASLSNYETGKRDLPLSTLLGVSKALEVSLGDLLENAEVVVVRDSRLSRAVERLVRHPELAENRRADGRRRTGQRRLVSAAPSTPLNLEAPRLAGLRASRSEHGGRGAARGATLREYS